MLDGIKYLMFLFALRSEKERSTLLKLGPGVGFKAGREAGHTVTFYILAEIKQKERD